MQSTNKRNFTVEETLQIRQIPKKFPVQINMADHQSIFGDYPDFFLAKNAFHTIRFVVVSDSYFSHRTEDPLNYQNISWSTRNL